MMEGLQAYPEYTDSGIPWLGEIPSHWQLKKMKYLFSERSERGYPNEPLLAATQTKGVVKKDDFETRTVVATKDLDLLKLVKIGDYVISLRSFQGGIEYAHCQGIISPAYTILKPSEYAIPYFFRFYFKSHRFVDSLSLFVTGIREGQNIDYVKLSRSHIPLLPLNEQKLIGKFLSYKTSQIAKFIKEKNREIHLLNEQKQAIIHQAVTRGLDPSVPMKPSGIEWLGEIPEHWDVKRLRHISPSISVGLVINPSSYFTDTGIPMLLGNNVTRGGFKLNNVRRISTNSNEILSKSKLSEGDLVIVRVGAPGTTAVIPKELAGCNCASMVIVRKSITFNSFWLAYSFNSSSTVSQIDIVKYGAAQKQFNISHAVNFWFPVPPINEQFQIVQDLNKKLGIIDSVIESIEKEIDFIREYRTRLITDVVTGKLDVRSITDTLPDIEDIPLDIPTDEEPEEEFLDEEE